MRSSASNLALAEAFSKPTLQPDPFSREEGDNLDKKSRPLKLSTVSGTSTIYNIKEMSPDFQFLIMIELAETLAQEVLTSKQANPMLQPAQLNPRVLSKLEFLIHLCTSQIPKQQLGNDASLSQSAAASKLSSAAQAAPSNNKKKKAMEDVSENLLTEDDELTEFTEGANSNYVILVRFHLL